MMRLLQGKVAIVTGAAHPKGIGRAVAKAFIEHGAKVLVADLGASEGMASAAQELSPDGLADVIACDVTDSKHVAACVEHCLSRFGQLDILVNNAGVGIGSDDFMQLTDSDWDISMAVNVRGIVNFCQAVIPVMQQQGQGVIVNNASLAGLGVIPGIPACYTASKFAAVGLSKQIALQYAADNIRCNIICPGSIVTQMHGHTMELIAKEQGVSLEQAQEIENGAIPLGYSANPVEIGKTAVYLASDLAAYVTGVTLPVAGGMSPGL